MIEESAKNLVELKQEFSKTYNGTSHIQEVVPISKSQKFPFEEKDFEFLHAFAKNNPIYYNSYKQEISDVSCMVYEGDINKYWLNSIQHGSSRAPFSPTWLLSAYISTLYVKELGYRQVIDIGSGDGRIAYCAKILDLDSFSIEIDISLVELQNKIVQSSGIDFNPKCSDAITFDYSSLNLTKPSFFIGGLAQMGGIALGTGILENVKTNAPLMENTGMVFAGTNSPKYSPDPINKFGWGTLIAKYALQEIKTITLPTVWTFKEPCGTPYLFVKLI